MVVVAPLVQEKERARVLVMSAALKNRVVGSGRLLLRPVLVMLWVCVGQERGQCKCAGRTQRGAGEACMMTARLGMSDAMPFCMHVWTDDKDYA